MKCLDQSTKYGMLIDKTLKKITSRYLQEFKEAGVSLSMEQWVILNRIEELGDVASQIEISKMSYRNPATTSRVIGGLCKSKYLVKERFEGDAKRYKLKLTREGQAILGKARPIVKKLRAQGYKNIEPYDFETFLKVLDQFYTNFDQ